LLDGSFVFHCGNTVYGVAFVKPYQDLIGGVLQSGCGLVELAGRLRGELAKLITVPDMG
jgi:hypothetical protein